MVVKPEIVEEYNTYQDLLLEKTVFSANCKSGYKNERGTITGQFGGSVSSFKSKSFLISYIIPKCQNQNPEMAEINGYTVLLDDLHAECFDLKFRSENRFACQGDGTTRYDGADPAWYMDE